MLFCKPTFEWKFDDKLFMYAISVCAHKFCLLPDTPNEDQDPKSRDFELSGANALEGTVLADVKKLFRQHINPFMDKCGVR